MMLLIIFLLFVVWSPAILGLIATLCKFRISPNRVIIMAFLLFGCLIGLWSSYMGEAEIVAVINLPGRTVSEMIYNNYLIPYWKETLEPTGYENLSIIEIETGEIIGVTKEPQYDFPLKNVSDMIFPVSILTWGLSGLVIQLIYNTFRKYRGSSI